MKEMLLAASVVALVGLMSPAEAAISVSFCTGGSCAGDETQVYLDKATNSMTSSGHAGSQDAANPLTFSSTSMLDFANGYSTISIHGNDTFKNLTVTAPTGFGFEDLVFSALAPRGGSAGGDITITTNTGDSSGPLTVGPGLTEFGVVASGGLLTSVTLSSSIGFDQLKEFNVSGFASIPTSGGGGGTGPGVGGVPEASTWVMMLLGFAGLGFAGYRTSRKSVAAV